MEKKLTPMMEKYIEIKEGAKDHIVFFRLGDFYEMFYDDAVTVSRELGLTLTGRGTGDDRVPMCGVPHHAANVYIKRLIDRGYSVAMCEQLTAPTKGKGMVERGIVKVITPGTLIEEEFLEGNNANYIAAVFFPNKGESGSISWADVSTGEFSSIAVNSVAGFLDVLASIAPREVVMTSDFRPHIKGGNFRATDRYDYAFNPLTAHVAILKYFGIKSTDVFDFSMSSPIVSSSGALLEYLVQTQKQNLPNISKINVLKSGEFMFLDRAARDNLELTRCLRTGKVEGSLLWVLDDTVTPMGSRKLSNIVSQPLQKKDCINKRLDAIEALVNDTATRRGIRDQLFRMTDLGRLTGRIGARTASPRDLVALGQSMGKIAAVREILQPVKSGLLKEMREDLSPIQELEGKVLRALVESPPIKLDDGGFIRDGYNKDLDEFRSLSREGHVWISHLEDNERKQTQIKEIKVGYNRVTGYYLEIPKRLSGEVPFRLTRIATTTNTERYVTDELKQLERKILGAQDSARALEMKILGQLRDEAVKHIGAIKRNSDALAMLDCLCCLASVAITNKWVRPSLNEAGELNLVGARHPVVEKILGAGRFIANDTQLRRGGKSTMIITGPNMAGKSTYMRSVALCVLMAHIGSFVPCDSADVAIVDRIFTRIGASDSLQTGESTFMVEMQELSSIINNATGNSLVLLDEVGRGTGTRDGLAIATSATNYITGKIGCMTMFATHFHELVALSSTNSRITNYRAATAKTDDGIVFLHKIEPGVEENSFGIEVAKLAGLPKEVLDNAKRIYDMS